MRDLFPNSKNTFREHSKWVKGNAPPQTRNMFYWTVGIKEIFEESFCEYSYLLTSMYQKRVVWLVGMNLHELRCFPLSGYLNPQCAHSCSTQPACLPIPSSHRTVDLYLSVLRFLCRGATLEVLHLDAGLGYSFISYLSRCYSSKSIGSWVNLGSIITTMLNGNHFARCDQRHGHYGDFEYSKL